MISKAHARPVVSPPPRRAPTSNLRQTAITRRRPLHPGFVPSPPLSLTVALTLSLSLLLYLLLAPAVAHACTNLLVSPGASTDGSTFITYSADSHSLYGDLPVLPAGVYAPGDTIAVHDWDSGRYLGRIPQAPVTYAVVGHINEHQLAIGETTFGGRKKLVDPKGVIDYGSLMFLTLQRAKTAREAIDVMIALVTEHGYASSGESFSLSDPKEAWILEMVGRGEWGKGVLWVARRVPDGFVSAHANAARIRQFPRNDKHTLFAPDVVQFARDRGWFAGDDADFSFADTYAPADFGSRRYCDARVWQFFRRVAPSQTWATDWIDGKPDAQPLPLWIKPDRKLGVRDVMDLMRDHYQDTPYDLSQGVGAGPFGLPYRWRPLEWKAGDKTYFNERATSTQQTGFSLVAQSRAWLPGPIGGILWFGVDDTALTVYVPMYAGILESPRAFAPGTADFRTFSWESAFWVFNWVSNWAYTRYRDMIVDVRAVQQALEGAYVADVAEVDRAALDLFKRSPRLAREYLTTFAAERTAAMMARWRLLGQELFVKYMDGNVRDANGTVTHPPYPAHWYDRINAERPGFYQVLPIPGELPQGE